MLRRNILTSAMASVMALTSISAVAFADETATDVKNVKTKADLEAYVKSFDGFRSKELYDYGSISGENFLNALEYADNVLDDQDSEAEDFTAAYAMIEAVYNKLKIYSVSDLRDMISSSKKIYETNNIYNEELGDAIYDADTFSEFEDAYETAEAVLNSSDSRIITDAYEELDAAKNNLKLLGTVTKSQFRTALKAYESALQKEFAYDAWRVGTVEGSSEATGWALWSYDGKTYAYGTLYEHVASLEAEINAAYSELDGIKALSKTSQVNLVDAYNHCIQATAVLNGFKADDTNRANKSNVQSLLNQYHGRLVYDYNTSAAKELYDAVISAVGADNVQVLQMKNGYSTEMKAANEVTNPWCVDKANYTVDPNGGTWSTSVEKIVSAEITVKAKSAFYIVLDDNGNATGEVVTGAKPAGKNSKLISKNASCDLTDYIAVPLENVTTGTDNHLTNNVIDGDDAMRNNNNQIGQWAAIAGAAQDMDGTYTNSSKEVVDTYTDLGTALEIAYLYINGAKDDIKGNTLIEDIDTIDAIAEGSAKGASVEWALVYRYLRYALADKYDASYGTHTKAEVSELIDKCYDLAELTGDAALFNYNHTRLVRARQDALEWVKAANKIRTYKDNVTSAEIVYGADKIITGDLVATDVYSKLKEEYDKLEKDYNAFKYSFDQIYNYLNEVADLIDSGKVVVNDNIKNGMTDTAYYLSTVNSLDEALIETNWRPDEIDNDAFTSDRFFQGFNRVYTMGDDEYEIALAPDGSKAKVAKSSASAASMSHKNLRDAYEGLKKEIDAQINPNAKLGDVNKDGVINAIDAALILKAAADGTVDTLDKAVADFNTDGAINALDAAAILKGVAAGTLK